MKLSQALSEADADRAHRLLTSGDASALAVENEHVISGERAKVPGSPVTAQELDFQGVGREQFDDGPHVARADFRII